MKAWRRFSRRAALLLALLVSAARQISAQGTPAGNSFLDRQARIRVYNVPLLDALRDLERRAGIALAYSPSLLPGSVRVTCGCETMTVRDALRVLLSNTAFAFRESDGQIMLFPVDHDVAPRPMLPTRDTSSLTPRTRAESLPVGETRSAGPDSATITGTVTTEAGTPLASALVALPSLHRSAITSDRGVYRFVVSVERLVTRPETLRVMRLGFKPAGAVFSLAG